MGYDLISARELAARPDIDLHRAIELVEAAARRRSRSRSCASPPKQSAERARPRCDSRECVRARDARLRTAAEIGHNPWPMGALLGYIPSPSSGVIHVGPLTIHLYGLTLLVAILLCVWLTTVRWKRAGRRHRPRHPRHRLGRRLRRRRGARLPRHHLLERGADAEVAGHLRGLEGRARHLGRDPARHDRRRDRRPPRRRQRRPPSWTRSRRASCSPRASAGSATGGTRSSTASRRRCRGA